MTVFVRLSRFQEENKVNNSLVLKSIKNHLIKGFDATIYYQLAGRKCRKLYIDYQKKLLGLLSMCLRTMFIKGKKEEKQVVVLIQQKNQITGLTRMREQIAQSMGVNRKFITLL
jgi:hypothetical protein